MESEEELQVDQDLDDPRTRPFNFEEDKIQTRRNLYDDLAEVVDRLESSCELIGDRYMDLVDEDLEEHEGEGEEEGGNGNDGKERYDNVKDENGMDEEGDYDNENENNYNNRGGPGSSSADSSRDRSSDYKRNPSKRRRRGNSTIAHRRAPLSDRSLNKLISSKLEAVANASLASLYTQNIGYIQSEEEILASCDLTEGEIGRYYELERRRAEKESQLLTEMFDGEDLVYNGNVRGENSNKSNRSG